MSPRRSQSPRCVVPGCTHDRPKGHRLCRRCYAALPAEIRGGILNAWFARPRRMIAYRQWVRAAGTFMKARRQSRAPATYQNTARLLGERD
ncbi:hypothetical protein [Stakelama pacifica]|uniref:Uncharacterized protein n=1 Tax=Stakelama pacifica TaxID=517720 RepID=A0A4R6FQL1_9SPHN|nr:hypothetical protein [Stakelama pacifica]TDN83015.1 hypothetical protein EV664_105213 [Stakelama pacifica]GGO94927.1 hypothetical protein GCM10011329_17910 [Stakelama pacifica]